jgi:hypothetical protein
MRLQPTPTHFLQDFLQYYYRAALLEERNHQDGKTVTVGDPLQDNVTIYDTVHRKYAGFSNVLRDLHADGNKRSFEEWLFIYGVHRMTGSGASFFPAWEGDRRHGYYNVIAPELGRLPTINDMVHCICNWKKPMFSSYGNQPPPFPKPPTENGWDQGGRYFFCEVWPHFVKLINEELGDFRRKYSISKFTDWMLALNVENGFKRFKFTYTAFVMDIADWHPDLIDPASECYYGANCVKSLNAMYSLDNRTKSDTFYHLAMEDLIERCDQITGDAKPMDVEDVLCDIVRYWDRFVPRFGYDHLSLGERETTSIISLAEWQEFCARV